jgi:hypothetical protein
MSTTINELKTEGLSIKLTEEKLFITTATSTETFALRSIDGIGVIDLVDSLNQELVAFNQKNVTQITNIVSGLVILVMGIYISSVDTTIGVVTLLIGLAWAVFAFLARKNTIKPSLKSAVRIMMTGGNRDFMFDKANSNSIEVAEFVAKIEDTLTAFHKK